MAKVLVGTHYLDLRPPNFVASAPERVFGATPGD